MELKELRTKLIEANKAYRAGHPVMSDYEYDNLVDNLSELNPHDEILLKVGHIDEKDSRKEKLPIEMASMNKCKTVEELKKWAELKQIPDNTTMVLTPKYDGASFCVMEEKRRGWTRGNGLVGQRSDQHLKALTPGKQSYTPNNLITFGEVILPTVKWIKWSETYANPRNMVSGQLNSDVPGAELEDSVYVRYGTNMDSWAKTEQLDLCNTLNSSKVPSDIMPLNKITEKHLLSLFERWKKDFSLDGIIVEVNDAELRQSLGRERSGNPAFARAYKGNFEEQKETTVEEIEWNVSKQGYLKPVGHVVRTNLDGANVTNVTLFNAKFVYDMGIGEGAKILIKRSGQVIPFVVSVSKRGEVRIPPYCPSCKSGVDWNDNMVELVCENDDCTSKRLNKIISFFDIMGVENVGEGIFTQLYTSGYNTVEYILNMKESDFRKLEGFGDRKAEIVYSNIHSKMQNVSLSKLQHASGVFRLLGSKKLVLLEDLYDSSTTIEDILKVEGFAEKSAKDYLQGLPKFKAFIKNLPITVKKESKMVSVSNKYEGMNVVFTGFRSKDFEAILTENGAKIGGSVSKKTTHLVMKEKGSGSGKEQKALDLGVTIWDADDLKTFLTE